MENDLASTVRVTHLAPPTRVYPSSWTPSHSTSHSPPSPSPAAPEGTLLSIVDAAVARWNTSGATWFFDAAEPAAPPAAAAPTDASEQFAARAEQLKASLERVLDSYELWCGQLRPVPFAPDKGSAHRFRAGRIEVALHRDSGPASQDPGVGFVVAACNLRLDTFIPSPAERGTQNSRHRAWTSDDDLFDKLVVEDPKLQQPLHDGADPAKNPSMVVQVTLFACGGVAITVRIAHSLADAHGLTHFVKAWSAVHRAMTEQRTAVPQPTPLFDPRRLDAAASGDIDAPQPDPDIIRHARSLPVNRFDWWASRHDCPFPSETGSIPPELDSDPTAHQPAGDLMSWSDWDVSSAVSHSILHFSRAQIRAIWEQARGSDAAAAKISKNDAVLAHVWACVNRARKMQNDPGMVHCDLTYGLRQRTVPPLGDDFMGSPIMHADVKLSGADVCSKPIDLLAREINATLKKFDAPAIGAQLHSIAYDHTPQRIWGAFVGKRHILVTSWVHTGILSADFGFSPDHRNLIRYVRPVMPPIDGCIQLTEGVPFLDDSRSKADRHWDFAGLDVSVHLEAEAMKELLASPLLFPQV